jgi:hypothetical protein
VVQVMRPHQLEAATLLLDILMGNAKVKEREEEREIETEIDGGIEVEIEVSSGKGEVGVEEGSGGRSRTGHSDEDRCAGECQPVAPSLPLTGAILADDMGTGKVSWTANTVCRTPYCCTVLLCSVVFYCVLFCSVLLCSVLLCCVVLCCVVLCCVLLCTISSLTNYPLSLYSFSCSSPCVLQTLIGLAVVWALCRHGRAKGEADYTPIKMETAAEIVRFLRI